MSKSSETSSRQTGEGSKQSVANTVSENAVSLPAITALAEKDPGAETGQALQRKRGEGVIAFKTNPTAGQPDSVAAETASVQFKTKAEQSSSTASQVHTPFRPVQKKENKTGLPDNLKAGIENISGVSMDQVNVHYNSSQPAQLNALAYAQGTNIHVGPGQEKHLPHEAWHVVQQAQGRVQATTQMKGNIPVNDDKGLEQEADVMGAKAVEAGNAAQLQAGEEEETLQGKFDTNGGISPVQMVKPGDKATAQGLTKNVVTSYPQTGERQTKPHGGRELRAQLLSEGVPRATVNGLTFTEYDVNQKVQGQNRDSERIVVSNTGRIWYTDDHYKTFTEIV